MATATLLVKNPENKKVREVTIRSGVEIDDLGKTLFKSYKDPEHLNDLISDAIDNKVAINNKGGKLEVTNKPEKFNFEFSNLAAAHKSSRNQTDYIYYHDTKKWWVTLPHFSKDKFFSLNYTTMKTYRDMKVGSIGNIEFFDITGKFKNIESYSNERDDDYGYYEEGFSEQDYSFLIREFTKAWSEVSDPDDLRESLLDDDDMNHPDSYDDDGEWDGDERSRLVSIGNSKGHLIDDGLDYIDKVHALMEKFFKKDRGDGVQLIDELIEDSKVDFHPRQATPLMQLICLAVPLWKKYKSKSTHEFGSSSLPFGLVTEFIEDTDFMKKVGRVLRNTMRPYGAEDLGDALEDMQDRMPNLFITR